MKPRYCPRCNSARWGGGCRRFCGLCDFESAVEMFERFESHEQIGAAAEAGQSVKHLAKKAKQLAVDTTKVKLTQRQIDAMVAKLSANGLAPGARVFDVNDGPYDDE